MVIGHLSQPYCLVSSVLIYISRAIYKEVASSLRPLVNIRQLVNHSTCTKGEVAQPNLAESGQHGTEETLLFCLPSS